MATTAVGGWHWQIQSGLLRQWRRRHRRLHCSRAAVTAAVLAAVGISGHTVSLSVVATVVILRHPDPLVRLLSGGSLGAHCSTIEKKVFLFLSHCQH